MNQLNVRQVSRAMGVSLSPLATNTVPSPFLGGHKRQVKFLGDIRISQKGVKHDSQANDAIFSNQDSQSPECAVRRPLARPTNQRSNK